MRFARVAATVAAVALAPCLGHATVYRIDAVVDGTPEAFGTIGVADSIVASGSLGLFRTCPQFGPCREGGPWDQVTFDLLGGLQAAVTGTGAGAIADFSLSFGADGNVTGGSIQVEGSESPPGGTPFLSVSTNGEPGPCVGNGTVLCGTYIPVMFAEAVPISITFVQEAASAIPAPGVGFAVLLMGAAGLAVTRRRT